MLQFAASENRIVLTLNRKQFIRLHQQNSTHHDIIVCTYDPYFAAQAARIHAVLEEQPELSKQLLRVNRPVN